jgi:hypothetical protein
VELEKPYFVQDDLLDPPGLPQPGWFADVDIAVVVPHVKNGLRETVAVGSGTDNILLPTTPLDWTVSPRLEAGYRLPSGFGEFALAYRFLASEGTGRFGGLDGAAALKSRVDFNVIDVDYLSRELSLGPHWDMKWRIGLRTTTVYFDTAASEPFGVAAAGQGILDARASNHYWGMGGHGGVDLARHLDGTGLSLVGRLDLGTVLGRVIQHFYEDTTTVGPDGRLVSGAARDSDAAIVPTITFQLGVSYQPPQCQPLRVFLGYQYDHWWEVGRVDTTHSRGELTDQGFLLRAELNY